MEQAVKRRARRKRPSLPLALLAVVVVLSFFGVAAPSRKPEAAAPPPSAMEKAAVVWCVLNRVDAAHWPDTVAEVVTQPYQFAGYSPDYPATEELKEIAADVLTRWERERREGGDVGRVLPAEYHFFTGDGERNYFRTEFTGGVFWDWTLPNPYSS